ncbi:MAG: hypothetical protein Q4C96_11300 [Planctomycetia bacterium]|nr:hypothetical protein [Planctomycetia bacterium]
MKRYLSFIFLGLFIMTLCLPGCGALRGHRQAQPTYVLDSPESEIPKQADPNPKPERKWFKIFRDGGQSPEAQTISEEIDRRFEP